MSDSENTNYIENDSEDSFHPDEESSSNDSDEPSASSKRPKNSRKKSSVSIFTSTPRNSASHRLSKTVSRNTMLDMLNVYFCFDTIANQLICYNFKSVVQGFFLETGGGPLNSLRKRP